MVILRRRRTSIQAFNGIKTSNYALHRYKTMKPKKEKKNRNEKKVKLNHKKY